MYQNLVSGISVLYRILVGLPTYPKNPLAKQQVLEVEPWPVPPLGKVRRNMGEMAYHKYFCADPPRFVSINRRSRIRLKKLKV